MRFLIFILSFILANSVYANIIIHGSLGPAGSVPQQLPAQYKVYDIPLFDKSNYEIKDTTFPAKEYSISMVGFKNLSYDASTSSKEKFLDLNTPVFQIAFPVRILLESYQNNYFKFLILPVFEKSITVLKNDASGVAKLKIVKIKIDAKDNFVLEGNVSFVDNKPVIELKDHRFKLEPTEKSHIYKLTLLKDIPVTMELSEIN